MVFFCTEIPVLIPIPGCSPSGGWWPTVAQVFHSTTRLRSPHRQTVNPLGGSGPQLWPATFYLPLDCPRKLLVPGGRWPCGGFGWI